MKFFLSFLWVQFFFTSSLFAQHLKEKAEMGIHLNLLSQENAAYSVKSVVPNSTADQIGLLQNDILLKLNKVALAKEGFLLQELAKYAEGDSLSLEVQRGDSIFSLSGTFLRPKRMYFGEKVQTYLKEISFDGGYSRAILNTPSGKGPFPTIVFLQGYTCQSVDWRNSQNVFMRVLHHWLSNGYAVVRFEKAGVGNYINQTPCEEYGFEHESSFFRSAFEQLVSWEEIDKDQIILYGHSLGGVHAPILANQFAVKGIMTYGTIGRPWKNYLLAMPQHQTAILYPSSDVDLSIELETADSALSKAFSSPDRWTKILSKDEINVLHSLYSVDESMRLFGRSMRFWAEISNIHPLDYWNNLKIPILSMYGTSDIAALNDQDARRIAKESNENGNQDAIFQLIQNADHSLISVPSQRESVLLKTNGAYQNYYNEGPNREFLAKTLAFLKQITDS